MDSAFLQKHLITPSARSKLAYVTDAMDEEDIVAVSRHSFVDMVGGLSES